MKTDSSLLKLVLRTLLSALVLPCLHWPCLGLETMPVSGGEFLPFSFQPAPSESGACFIAHGANYVFSIGHTGVQVLLESSRSPAPIACRAVSFQFAGANPLARLIGIDNLPGQINYLIGADPQQWRSHVPHYARVRATAIYPGIDVVYYGSGQKLEYDLEISPGADPRLVALQFCGIDSARTDSNGDLILSSGFEQIRQPRPFIYQTYQGRRQTVSGGYHFRDAHTIDFALGPYDTNRLLVIDPMLSYSTFFGGNQKDVAYAVKVAADGSIFIAGETTSRTNKFIDPASIHGQFAGGGLTGDAFVAKFGPGGTNLVYYTYIGGTANEGARDLAIDDAGHAFITGFTDSTNFPTLLTNTPFGLTNHINGRRDPNVLHYLTDAFITELDTDGASLVYSAYLGGSLADVGAGIAIDPAGNAYVTGYTYSSNFPVVNGFQTNRLGTNDIFVSKIAPFGAALLYSTFAGGTNIDQGEGIAVDPSGVAYVTGYTSSTNFPVTANALQSQISGSTNATVSYRGRGNVPADAFLLRIDTSLSGAGSLTYSTLLGGTNNDYGFRIALDSDSNVYLTGTSSSTNFPDFNHPTNIHAGAIKGVAVNNDAFLTKYHFDAPDTATMIYSVLFGGYQNDAGWGVTLDGAGNIYVVGTTTSKNFPTNNTINFQTNNPSNFIRATNSGRSDAFLAAFDTNAVSLYCGYFGGRNDDFAYAVAVDSATNLYIVGKTVSPNFPITAPPGILSLQTNRNGPYDAFLAIVSQSPPAAPAPPQNPRTAGGGYTPNFEPRP